MLRLKSLFNTCATMNKEFILKKTRSYDDWLIELKEPKEARAYLEAMQSEPERRFGSATEMKQALLDCLDKLKQKTE